jgi:serine/threonine-protein kinase
VWQAGLVVGVVVVIVAAGVVIGVNLRGHGGSWRSVSAASAASTTPSPTPLYQPVGELSPAYAGTSVWIAGGFQVQDISVRRDGVLYVSGYSADGPAIYSIGPSGTLAPVTGDDRVASVSAGSQATVPGAGDVGWDNAGNLYVADINGYRIRKIDAAGVVTTVAGNGTPGYSGDGGPATQAQIGRDDYIAVLGDGTIYVADHDSNRIRRITSDGIITTVAGTGQVGFTPGPAQAATATLGGPNTIAAAPDGSIYFTNESSGTVQRISPTGELTTVAGSGYWDVSADGRSGEGDVATSAAVSLTLPSVGLGPDGSVYIASPGNNNVRKVGPDGIIRTIAGTGAAGADGDGGPAMAATFVQPLSVAVDVTGAVYVVDSGNLEVRRIAPDGTITTIATASD